MPVTVTIPLFPPLHETSVFDVTEPPGEETGWVTVADVFAVHPFESVIVTE